MAKKLPKKVRAVLARRVEGHFTKWRKGTKVWARRVPGIGWCIERRKRIPSGIYKEGLPLQNEMVGLAKKDLIFQ